LRIISVKDRGGAGRLSRVFAAPREEVAVVEGLSARVLAMIKAIPRGKVARLLHSSSAKHGLPWHRVVNAQGRISLPAGGGRELQKKLLEAEGVRFEEDRIDFSKYGWRPSLE
jgi:methylated-DNA-protein-cysteine methyltransferase-like protein